MAVVLTPKRFHRDLKRYDDDFQFEVKCKIVHWADQLAAAAAVEDLKIILIIWEEDLSCRVRFRPLDVDGQPIRIGDEGKVAVYWWECDDDMLPPPVLLSIASG